MARLVIQEAPETQVRSTISELLIQPQWKQFSHDAAGVHTVHYEWRSEIRFGPALYSVAVASPNGSFRPLGEALAFRPKSPYQPELGWYSLMEWRGDINGQGQCAMKILDLERGKILFSHTMDLVFLAGWRGGASRECIIQKFTAFRSSDWYAFDVKTGKKRLLFRGGYEGHVSGDGKYLVVLYTRQEVFIALISIDTGSLLDLIEAHNLSAYASVITGLDTARFDADSPCLTAMLNWTKTDFQKNKVEFEKLLNISVAVD